MARALVTALYVSYPIGCVLQLIADETATGLALRIAGLSLVVVAFAAFAVLAGSSLQRQAQEPENLLDERELADRNRAAYQAHSVFAGIVLLSLIYLMLRQDLSNNSNLDLWAPTTGDHWNALFWGAAMLAMTLPAAFLAFRKCHPLEDMGE
jgi:hypothetical protein